MNEIRVDAVFQASSEPTRGRMCFIDPSLAAKPLTATVGTFEVVLEFPKFEGRFPAEGYVGWSGTDASAPLALCPAHFTAYTLSDLAPGLDEHAVQSRLKSAVAAIRFAATRLSDALRVEQPNVGMVGEIPKTLSLTAIDITQGLTLRLPEPLTPGYPIAVGQSTLSVDAAASALSNGVSPPRALLSQARYLTLSTNSPQPGMAILLAAVAAETYAKEVLQTRQSPGSAPSLRSLQRIYGTALDLYGQVAKAMIGRSLEDDDPPLWSDLGSLFNTRNKMAHRLKTPSHLDARQLVVAAMRATDWLG
ncbi:MAG TPA: hypothetical protein VGX23_27990 [Actinocrinis sp.]|nr:hypothetical protein [Actinocrinis sp.]